MNELLRAEVRAALGSSKTWPSGGSGRIIDLACGTGSFTQVLHEVLPEYELMVGMDVDPDLLEEAEDRFADTYINGELPLRFLRGDARDIRFPSGAFDLSAMSNGLHHVANVPGALGEIRRVTAPGGRIVLHEMVRDGLSPEQEVARDLHHFKARVDRIYGVSHRPTYSREEIDAFLRPLGLRTLHRREYLPGDEDGEPEPSIEERVDFVEGYAELVQGLPAYPGLRREADRLVHRLRSLGFSYPPQLLLVLEKPLHATESGGAGRP